MCPWVEQFGFCPYEAASKVWQWMHSFLPLSYRRAAVFVCCRLCCLCFTYMNMTSCSVGCVRGPLDTAHSVLWPLPYHPRASECIADSLSAVRLFRV